MEIINQIAKVLSKLFEWWFVVMPWEQAIFVRAGKNSKLLGKGIYFKIPFVDMVYIQSTRMRAIDVPTQTVTAKCGTTFTIRSCVTYSIGDMERLYQKMYHPEITLQSLVMGSMNQFIANHNSEDCNPDNIEKYVSSRLQFTDYGLKDISTKLTGFAKVKTFRIIQDSSWLGEGMRLDESKR